LINFMEKVKIAFDNDDVLFRFIPGFLKFHNEKYGTNFEESDIDRYDLWVPLGCTKREAIARVFRFYRSPLVDFLPPSHRAMESVDYLLDRSFELGVITSRPFRMGAKTERDIQFYFQDSFKEIILTGQYASDNVVKTKADVCLEKGYNILVDDYPGHLEECAAVGVRGVLITRNWNISYGKPENPLIKRAADIHVGTLVIERHLAEMGLINLVNHNNS